MTDTEEIRDNEVAQGDGADNEKQEEKHFEDLTSEEKEQAIRNATSEMRRRVMEATDVMKSGKGRLTLEKPLEIGDYTIKELVYDFTELTGLEYTDAMDSDPNAQLSFRVTARQALALFAKAAAKQTEHADMEDILEKMGATDSMVAAQLSTLFFNASTQAGRMRLSKK